MKILSLLPILVFSVISHAEVTQNSPSDRVSGERQQNLELGIASSCAPGTAMYDRIHRYCDRDGRDGFCSPHFEKSDEGVFKPVHPGNFEKLRESSSEIKEMAAKNGIDSDLLTGALLRLQIGSWSQSHSDIYNSNSVRWPARMARSTAYYGNCQLNNSSSPLANFDWREVLVAGHIIEGSIGEVSAFSEETLRKGAPAPAGSMTVYASAAQVEKCQSFAESYQASEIDYVAKLLKKISDESQSTDGAEILTIMFSNNGGNDFYKLIEQAKNSNTPITHSVGLWYRCQADYVGAILKDSNF